MSQFSFGNINEDTTTGTLLASYLEQFEAAVQSNNIGATAPSYAIQGMEWIDTSSSPAIVKRYTGTVWAAVGSLNLSTGIYIPYSNGSAMGGMSTLGVGDGLESSGGNARIKLDGSSLSRSSAGLKIPNKGITNTLLADGTIGAIRTYDASGVATDLAPGTAGQSIISQGAGQPLVWGDASGDCKLLTTRTVGFERDINFEGIFTSQYAMYQIMYTITGWDWRDTKLLFKRDGQGSYDNSTGNYGWSASYLTHMQTYTQSYTQYPPLVKGMGSINDIGLTIQGPKSGGGWVSMAGEFKIYHPRYARKTGVTGRMTYLYGVSTENASQDASGLCVDIAGVHKFEEAVNSLRFSCIDSGNGGGARDGIIKIYGYK